MAIKLHCPRCGSELPMPPKGSLDLNSECAFCLKTIAVPAMKSVAGTFKLDSDQRIPVLYKTTPQAPEIDLPPPATSARKPFRRASSSTMPRLQSKAKLSHISGFTPIPGASRAPKSNTGLWVAVGMGGILAMLLGVLIATGKSKPEADARKVVLVEPVKPEFALPVKAELPVPSVAPVSTPVFEPQRPVLEKPAMRVPAAAVPVAAPAPIEKIEPAKPVAPPSAPAVLNAPSKPNVIAEETELVEASKPAKKTPVALDANPLLPFRDPAVPVQPVKPVEPAKAAAAPAPAPVVCAECTGTRFVPLNPPVLYSRADGEAAPNPERCVPWKPCPRCNKGFDAATLLQAESARLTHTDDARNKWEPLVGDKLSFAETAHLTVVCQAPVVMPRTIATTLSKLTAYLESVSRSTLLTLTRPDTHTLVIVNGRASWMKLCDTLAAQNPGMDVSLMKLANGSHSRYQSLNSSDPNRLVDAQHFAVFQMGKMLMEEATNGKAPAWLNEGFGAFCENQMFESNLCYTFAYEKNEVRFTPNWNKDIKTFANKGQLKPWDQMFNISLEGIKALDYLTCYSMVAFLMRNDPPRFVKFVELIREGGDSAKSLEKVYGMKVTDLQVRWVQWSLMQK